MGLTRQNVSSQSPPGSGRVPGARSFYVTAAGEHLTLDASGTGEASFTVTNVGSLTLDGRLLPKALDLARAEWFSVVGESVRRFVPAAAERVIVQVRVPVSTAPGSYSFRLDAISQVIPDEDYTEGPAVSFDVPKPLPRRRSHWWIVFVAVAALLLASGVLAYVLWPTPQVTVPDVNGLSRAKATSTLQAAGLTVGSIVRQFSKSAADGVVMAQRPAATSRVSKHTRIDLVVASNATVPDVTGMTVADARTRLEAVKLSATARASNEVGTWGTVLRTEPSSGIKVRVGSVVTMDVVSLSSDQLLGRTLVDARKILMRRGLRVTSYYFAVGRIVNEAQGICERNGAQSPCIVAAFVVSPGGEAQLGVIAA